MNTSSVAWNSNIYLLHIQVHWQKCAPEATCWLAGIVYGSVQDAIFVSQSQNCAGTLDLPTQNDLLEDCEEQLAEYEKKRSGF